MKILQSVQQKVLGPPGKPTLFRSNPLDYCVNAVLWFGQVSPKVHVLNINSLAVSLWHSWEVTETVRGEASWEVFGT